MMKDTLRKVLMPYGPSGNEVPIAKALAELVKPYVDEIRTDAMGNLIATKRGKGGKRILFSAHMDSIGLIVVDADKEGFLRVGNIGGTSPMIYTARAVVFANGLSGVTNIEPLKGEKPELSKLYIDIGAKTREEALEKAPVGSVAVIPFAMTEMGDQLAAPFMDDRAACAVLVELLAALGETKNEVVAVFSVQEEVGCRGATAATYAIEPDIGVALDVTGTGDTPKSDPMAVKVGSGPAVKVKDSYSISTPFVRDGLIAAAGKAGVPFQYEVLLYGGTDAGSMLTSRAGVPAATLSIPCRYVHSPVETVSLRDMEQCVALLKAYVEEVVE